MTGLCLFVAVVHYPLMARVGREAWTEYERLHTARTGVVVAPLMLVEAGSAAWLTLAKAGEVADAGAWWWANLVGLGVVWGITFLVNVPQHQRLTLGWDAPTHRALVATHAVRTVVWAARGGLLLWLSA